MLIMLGRHPAYLPLRVNSHEHYGQITIPICTWISIISSLLNILSGNIRRFVIPYLVYLSWNRSNISLLLFENILLRNENIEIMCHPAIIDLDLYKSSSYCFERIKELDILCSEEIKEFIKDNNIELTHY